MSEKHCDENHICALHSGIEARVTITENNCKTIFGKLDAMQKWVIAGMGAVILQLVLLLMEIFKAKVA